MSTKVHTVNTNNFRQQRGAMLDTFKLLSIIVKIIAIALIALPVPSATAAVVYVTDYGAQGTGNEADASTNVSAFVAAINAAGHGGTVYVPTGLYYINDQIRPNKDNLTIDGYGSAEIKRVSTGTGDMQMIYMSTSTGCTIQGLVINGNRPDWIFTLDTGGWSFGILNDYGANLTVKNCSIIHNTCDGICIGNNVGNTKVENCTIVNNGRQGLAITDSSGGCAIKNCYFADNYFSGLDIEPNKHDTVHHTITGCTFDGDRLDVFGSGNMPWNTAIQDCNFINGAPLRVSRAMGTAAINNTFTGGGGISLNDATGYDGVGTMTLTGNSISGVTSNGVNLLANPSFESWTAGVPDNWTPGSSGVFTIEYCGPRAMDGSKAAHLEVTSGTARLRQSVSVTAGTYYTFGGYISGKLLSGSAHPIVKVNFRDSGDSVLKTIELYQYYTDYVKYQVYEKVMGITRAPAGSVTAEVIVGGEYSGSFNAYYDAMFFYEGIGPDEDLTLARERVLRFDFGPVDYYPHGGCTYIDPCIVYGGQEIEGINYGIFNTGSGTITADHWDNWQTRNTASNLCITGLCFPDEAPWGVSGFALEVPNGDYLVTVGAGKIAWNLRGKIRIENTYYAGNLNNENLYVLDVVPDKYDRGDDWVSDGYLTWTVVQDFNMHEPVGPYGEIRTWGYYGNNPYWDYMELLYLDDQLVTIADGNLTVLGMSDAGNDKWYLNFLEVVRSPANDCDQVWQYGFGLTGDLNHDCYVDLKDLHEFITEWLTPGIKANFNNDSDVDFADFAELAAAYMTCNDPQGNDCSSNW